MRKRNHLESLRDLERPCEPNSSRSSPRNIHKIKDLKSDKATLRGFWENATR